MKIKKGLNTCSCSCYLFNRDMTPKRNYSTMLYSKFKNNLQRKPIKSDMPWWVFYEEDKMFSHEGNNLTAIVSNVFDISQWDLLISLMKEKQIGGVVPLSHPPTALSTSLQFTRSWSNRNLDIQRLYDC